MTDLRTAARQALEALEEIADEVFSPYDNKLGDAILALRAALVQEQARPTVKESLQVEPAATTQQPVGDTPPSDYWRGYWAGFEIGKREGRIEAEDALAQPAPEPAQRSQDWHDGVLEGQLREREHWLAQRPEPVAWIHTDSDKPRVRFLEWREDEPGYRGRWIKTPLYTAPPQQPSPEPVARECSDPMCACRGGPCAECEEGQREKEIEDLRCSLDFYQRRCEALQSWQSKMRDPERTIVCDILANGFTLDPAFAGNRYTAPPQQTPLTEEEIDALWRAPMSADWEHREFARAIERAHGIGEQQ